MTFYESINNDVFVKSLIINTNPPEAEKITKA